MTKKTDSSGICTVYVRSDFGGDMDSIGIHRYNVGLNIGLNIGYNMGLNIGLNKR